ncbi:hypothetical protein Pst134EA_017840 [Puccinia striiformis f. sp. tritici]|uniref:Uncharacterized protein n=1 Tax=Puccinia striiformis f. sp. tritici PST-78 TaxID=1165861 RepID=A0A0L0VX46_9BASI|nr:uncharacterized protein Pst134EA_031756 [Puccinia striiformis f. sp. tritici]XP_047804488.1 hypothetical protein Pst134EA_017840 [Puccinia striiformis f. sp. tritici]KAH9442598.1 hypothetical protein Pst134EA_031756 [Puccinia striiformis f. sp. tritici]KAH9461541.1 hypothetical protein Pst134EA_017840 [Puccinia striiformis f. sp. tritici]KNF03884.1 hypothetical protein PSTG_02971 [Puccinia striiformis f. sp. tritici PST-78]
MRSDNKIAARTFLMVLFSLLATHQVAGAPAAPNRRIEAPCCQGETNHAGLSRGANVQ